MKNLINWLSGLFGPRVGGAAHAGDRSVYFTDVYRDGDTWSFSWRTADHSRGGLSEGFASRELANAARTDWAACRKASFVHENS